ncbi:synaptotagmin-3 [Aristolochia californica]|uniref:synaptotagmin-3 n=1 Tax=Aristolochia californica TaxID=171875 RepID=UPI0035DBAE51
MGFLSTLMGILGFGFGIPIGILVGFFIFIRSESRDVKDPIVRPLQEFDSETLSELLAEVPLWVKSPDYDRVDWMNKFILEMWPYLDKAICATIRSMVKPLFDDYIGMYCIESIDFGTLTLGCLPPTFQGMKVYETQEKELLLEPAIRWAGNANITVVLKILSLHLTVQLLDLQIFMAPRVSLKPLVPTFPCFSGISVSLIEKPDIDFGLKLLGGDIMSIPGFCQLVQKMVKDQIASLYLWPKTLNIPILDGSCGETRKPVGILHVKVVQALNLSKMDFWGKSDPYVKLSLSGERLPARKTTIKMKNLNPVWNEKFKLTVKDPETQVLQLHVYDWEKVGAHDKLGMQIIPLNVLVPQETKEFTLRLLKNLNPNDPQNKINRGLIMVELTFVPFRDDIGRFSAHLDREGTDSGIKDTPDDLPPKGGLLLVMLQGAEDVEGKRHTNPYAVILFRGEQRKTKVIKNTRDPMWNEEFQFVLEEAPIDERIHVEVMSKRRGFSFHSKVSLGHIDINLIDVVNNGRINEKYHLINSRNGMIHVDIRWKAV